MRYEIDMLKGLLTGSKWNEFLDTLLTSTSLYSTCVPTSALILIAHNPLVVLRQRLDLLLATQRALPCPGHGCELK